LQHLGSALLPAISLSEAKGPSVNAKHSFDVKKMQISKRSSSSEVLLGWHL
jgi:hypothetical protein